MKTLFLRDVQLAFRIGGGAGQSLAFFLIASSLLALGVGPVPELLGRLAPGALWVFALLSCLLSLDRLFQADQEDGSLDHIILAPTPLEAAVLAKAAAHWLTTAAPLIVLSPVLAAMLNLPDAAIPMLLLSLILGTPALSLIGAIGAALTVGLRRGGLLLSILVLPLYIPTLVFGASAVRQSTEATDPTTALLMLGAISLGSVVIGPLAAAAALRINQS